MLDDLGNLGELLGGIGVLITLIYLSFQVRQNTSTVKLSTAASFAQHALQSHSFIAQNPEINRLFWEGLQNPDSLSPGEYRYFESIFSAWIQSFHSAYMFNAEEALLDETWDQQAISLRWVVTQPGFRRYWSAWGSFYVQGFNEFIAELIAEHAEPQGEKALGVTPA